MGKMAASQGDNYERTFFGHNYCNKKHDIFCFTDSILQNIMVNNQFDNANCLSTTTTFNVFKVHVMLSQFETGAKFDGRKYQQT